VQVRGLIARTAVGPLDLLSAVRPRDLALTRGMDGPGRARLTRGAWGSAEPLHQVDLVVPVWVGGRATALLVAKTGVETGGLEGVGAQGHPVAIMTGVDASPSRFRSIGTTARSAVLSLARL